MAEMKLPGVASLEFELELLDGPAPRTRLRQTARFMPRGLLGILYWYAIMPFHRIVFSGMLSGIRRAALEGPPGPG